VIGEDGVIDNFFRFYCSTLRYSSTPTLHGHGRSNERPRIVSCNFARDIAINKRIGRSYRDGKRHN
jgi:hypothetical protein